MIIDLGVYSRAGNTQLSDVDGRPVELSCILQYGFIDEVDTILTDIIIAPFQIGVEGS